ncbi:hypothetical protein GCM10010524_31620 [Streptomyces mexicanus]
MIALSATAFPLRHLVAAYAAHPDFRPEWEPSKEEAEPDPRFSRTGRAEVADSQGDRGPSLLHAGAASFS